MSMFGSVEQDASKKARMEYHAIKLFVSLLSDFSVMFQGDFHETLIIALIHQRHKREEIAARQTGGCMDFMGKGVRLMDLARRLNIPRETTRRKLRALEMRGVVEKNGDGAWQLKSLDGKPAVHLPIEPFIARRLQDFLSLNARDMDGAFFRSVAGTVETAPSRAGTADHGNPKNF